MGGDRRSLSRTLRDWGTANPLSVLALLALVVYVELRLPAEIFYRSFGVTADDAGFGSIDVVLQQSAQLLAFYAAVGAVWALFVTVFIYPFIVCIGTVLLLDRPRDGDAARHRQKRRSAVAIVLSLAIPIAGLLLVGCAVLDRQLLLSDVDWPPLVLGALIMLCGFLVPRLALGADARAELIAARREARQALWGLAAGGLAVGAALLLLLSVAFASPAANDVKDGFRSDLWTFPWRARPATVVWKGETSMRLPDCRELTYLGEDSGRVLLYDERGERTLRLTSASVQLTFPSDC